MKNLLFEKVEYKIDETPRGVWRRYLYPDGQLFEEFVSHRWMGGVPLVHYTRGKCPETGKRIVARGVVAIGRLAVGFVAIGHASMGVFAVGQLAVGLLFGFGQAASGMIAVGQLALAGIIGIGQLATGFIAIGQFGIGRYVLAQLGVGTHVWDMRAVSAIARNFFRLFLPWVE
jgi:hypothetical protein